jgi:hypothetical protein
MGWKRGQSFMNRWPGAVEKCTALATNSRQHKFRPKLLHWSLLSGSWVNVAEGTGVDSVEITGDAGTDSSRQ